MPSIYEGRPDKEALRAAKKVAMGEASSDKLYPIKGGDASLVRALASDSTYRQVLSGASEKTFTAFPETRERSPHVYEKLEKLGYVAVEVER